MMSYQIFWTSLLLNILSTTLLLALYTFHFVLVLCLLLFDIKISVPLAISLACCNQVVPRVE